MSAWQAGADVVMLDNFNAEDMKRAAASLKQRHKHVLIEGSGGLTEDKIHTFFSPGSNNNQKKKRNQTLMTSSWFFKKTLTSSPWAACPSRSRISTFRSRSNSRPNSAFFFCVCIKLCTRDLPEIPRRRTRFFIFYFSSALRRLHLY